MFTASLIHSHNNRRRRRLLRHKAAQIINNVTQNNTIVYLLPMFRKNPPTTFGVFLLRDRQTTVKTVPSANSGGDTGPIPIPYIPIKQEASLFFSLPSLRGDRGRTHLLPHSIYMQRLPRSDMRRRRMLFMSDKIEGRATTTL